jgi:outer membrane receptor protein involved in Fe transport
MRHPRFRPAPPGSVALALSLAAGGVLLGGGPARAEEAADWRPVVSDAAPAPSAAARPALAEVVVTAARAREMRLEVPGSIARVDEDALRLIGSRQAAVALNRVAGVMVQRGSGQESLPAIRSPVLTGAGSCGAFLVLEDGLPIRPVGTCNVNELFELNTEQAHAIEVIRGPATAAYGAGAVHGIVNVITPSVADLDRIGASLEGGSDDFRRIGFNAATGDGPEGWGAYGHYTHDDGFRFHTATEEGKLNLLHDATLGDGELRLRAAGTLLNQDTGGFVRGFDAYRDPVLRLSNPNPEAFRNAWSTRASATYEISPCEGCARSASLLLRDSRMRFLQHFLLGEPLEQNGQRSLQISVNDARPLPGHDALRLRIGAELESADSSLLETQDAPTTGATAAARAIRPAGRHYDYDVKSLTGGAYAALEWQLAPRLRAGAALRADTTRYEYDNHMLAGNTDDKGVPCAFGGCLYSRPADRSDRFDNLTPKFDVSWAFAPTDRLYAAATRGFRPPEATELYRLQRQQTLADLRSERLDSAELGWRHEDGRFVASLAAFAMLKRHVILRDANGFNVSDGSTRHRGIEYELQARLAERITVSATGTFARHLYGFSRSIDQGETIIEGKDVDTAPRQLHRLAVEWSPSAAVRTELEVQNVGAYFADAANLRRYPGHTVANLVAGWRTTGRTRLTLRVENLFDRYYADRADFAQGEWRYFPARGRSVFLEWAIADARGRPGTAE